MVYLRGRCTTKGLTDLDEADPRPYVRLAARLRRQILDGEVAPGQRVPSITVLSRITSSLSVTITAFPHGMTLCPRSHKRSSNDVIAVPETVCAGSRTMAAARLFLF